MTTLTEFFNLHTQTHMYPKTFIISYLGLLFLLLLCSKHCFYHSISRKYACKALECHSFMTMELMDFSKTSPVQSHIFSGILQRIWKNV